MSSVLQKWVEGIPWKQQSILFSGLRGPDDQQASAVKKICKWLRSVSQNNADPSKGYMNPGDLPEPVPDSWLDLELERLPVHFVHHFADALRVVAIHYPEKPVRDYADWVHGFIAAELFHFKPESTEEFLWRHRDKVDHQ